MSVDYFSVVNTSTKNDPLLPQVKAGMKVVVSQGEYWWMGDVIYEEGRARDSKAPMLFQAACVDSGDPLGQCRPVAPRCHCHLNPIQ